MQNNFAPYQSGFQKGYDLAQKLIASKGFELSELDKHINELIQLRDAFEEFKPVISRERSEINGLLDSINTESKLLSLMLSSTSPNIKDNQFIVTVKRVFNQVNTSIFTYYNRHLSKTGKALNMPDFQSGSLSFEYKPSSAENNITATINDYNEMDDIVNYFSDNFGMDLAESNSDMKFLIGITVKIIGLTSGSKDYKKLLEDRKIYKLLGFILTKLDAMAVYILEDLTELDNAAFNLAADFEEIVDAYKEYRLDVAKNAPSLVQTKKPEKEEHPGRSAFEEKFNQLMATRQKSIVRRSRKQIVSHIVDRAIARIGK